MSQTKVVLLPFSVCFLILYHMKVFLTTVLFLVLGGALPAQNCHLVSMSLPIAAGVAKHHFPVQALPATAGDHFFTYLAEWNQGDLSIRIRFSNDGQEWTNWEVLKRNFATPEALHSPLQLAGNAYSFFEWAVYNKTGEACELALNFYYPIYPQPAYADIAPVPNMVVSTVGCPQPPIMVDKNAPSSIVSANEKD